MNTSKLFRQSVKALADEYHLRLHTLTENMARVNELSKACEELQLLPLVQVSDCGTVRLTAMSVGAIVTADLWARAAAHSFVVGESHKYMDDPTRDHFESTITRNDHTFNLVYSVARVDADMAVAA